MRHIVWRSVLNNDKAEKEYIALLTKNRAFTVSQFELNILTETRNFTNRFVSQQNFDATMIQCMKTILSYHEKKTDRILSDYHYLLCMPLIIAFSELRYMYSSPSELIGMY